MVKRHSPLRTVSNHYSSVNKEEKAIVNILTTFIIAIMTAIVIVIIISKGKASKYIAKINASLCH